MNPGESRHVIAPDGTRIHVVAMGSAGGPSIVLLHGFPDGSWGWREQMEPLAQAGFRVLAPDLRGYGQSDCPQGVGAYALDGLVADVLAVGGAAPFHLVGHDWGGIIAFAAAAWYPDRIAALTIINAPHLSVVAGVMRADPRQLVRSAYIAFFQLTRLAEALLRARGYRLLTGLLLATALPGTFTRSQLARYRREWARPGRLTAMLNYYRALVRRAHRPLGRIAVPTQILWGRLDPALGPALAEASLAMCGQGSVEWFADASHWPHLDEPARVNAALVSFHRSCGGKA